MLSQNVSVNWAAGSIFSYILWSDKILPFFKKQESFAFYILQVWDGSLPEKDLIWQTNCDLAKCWCSAYAAIFPNVFGLDLDALNYVISFKESNSLGIFVG